MNEIIVAESVFPDTSRCIIINVLTWMVSTFGTRGTLSVRVRVYHDIKVELACSSRHVKLFAKVSDNQKLKS